MSFCQIALGNFIRVSCFLNRDIPIVIIPYLLTYCHGHLYPVPQSVLGLSTTPSPTDYVLSIFLIQPHLPNIFLDLVPPFSVGSSGQSFAFRRAFMFLNIEFFLFLISTLSNVLFDIQPLQLIPDLYIVVGFSRCT